MLRTRELQPIKTADGGEVRFSTFAGVAEQWLSFADRAPDASLYHRGPWLELLRIAHGADVRVASLEYKSRIKAGCLFARSGPLFARRFVSLPDSEICGPLAEDLDSRNLLLQTLAAHPETRAGFEIHGVECPPPPWQTVDTFAHWDIDLDQPQEKLHKALDRDVRRNMRHALEAGISVTRGSTLEHLRRFYILHLETRRRLGVPPRPFRYFKHFHRVFEPELSVWIAEQGGVDLAGLVMLRDRDTLYAKMNARSANCPNGANHLMFVSAMDEFAGQVRNWDLGRVDIRNRGLTDFKKRLGASSHPLPYAYLPRAPRYVSSEILTGPAQFVSQAWRWLPIWTTRVLGSVAYGLLV